MLDLSISYAYTSDEHKGVKGHVWLPARADRTSIRGAMTERRKSCRRMARRQSQPPWPPQIDDAGREGPFRATKARQRARSRGPMGGANNAGQQGVRIAIATAAFAASLVAVPIAPVAQQPDPTPISIGDSDLGGLVASPNGPEAGVWIIAETTELPTKFARIVVTDDRGRYLIPDLPKAKYSVWVRGYGLVDSAKVQVEPGRTIDLKAAPAASPAAAAEYYPAVYWYSLLEIPDKSLFPGTGTNGMPVQLKSQGQWLDIVKTDGCYTCHQLGDKATRTMPPNLGKFEILGRCMGTAHSVGPGRYQHGDQHRQAGHAARAEAVRRMDRSHCRRRVARRAAAAAARRRTQRRRHRMGLGDAEGLSA